MILLIDKYLKGTVPLNWCFGCFSTTLTPSQMTSLANVTPPRPDVKSKNHNKQT